jgi:hypothetical protein
VSWSLGSTLSPSIGLFMNELTEPPFKFPDVLWPTRKFPFKRPYQGHESLQDFMLIFIQEMTWIL